MMMRIPPHTSSQTVWIGKGHDQVPIKTQIHSNTCFGEIGSEGIAHPRCRGWECVLRVDSDVGQTHRVCRLNGAELPALPPRASRHRPQPTRPLGLWIFKPCRVSRALVVQSSNSAVPPLARLSPRTSPWAGCLPVRRGSGSRGDAGVSRVGKRARLLLLGHLDMTRVPDHSTVSLVGSMVRLDNAQAAPLVHRPRGSAERLVRGPTVSTSEAQGYCSPGPSVFVGRVF